MSSFARRIAGDSAVAAGVASAFIGFVLAVVAWIAAKRDPGQTESDMAEGLLAMYVVGATLPIWYAAWAMLLRRRRAPLWWVTPLVATTPGMLFLSALEDQSDGGTDWIGAALAVVLTAAAAGVWSWLWEQSRPRELD